MLYRFYTFWNIFLISILLVFGFLNYIPNGIRDLVFISSLAVYLGGILLTYGYPKNFYIYEYDYNLSHRESVVSDIIFHQIPFLIICLIYGYLYGFSHPVKNFVSVVGLTYFLIIVICYSVYQNPFTRYVKLV